MTILRRFVMRYPGDPPANVYEMTRDEFLRMYPRQPIKLEDLNTGEVLKEYPMELDEINCDFCNADPGTTVWLYRIRSIARGYCAGCAQQSWMPYCQEIK